ncbi:hypothetical protein CKAN_01996000 [Cinnamomum micranthum f. kanehirae]|uniref:Uncharacterized protein n=1 Tax=Cinnamomum micranthum f. kanehirae TaxID=337451 RepID=A0A3S3NMU1_9MAGN|nr:hypothetical protein CKAN_01996000 [Cinnamomum micranthum f. kanehirae]
MNMMYGQFDIYVILTLVYDLISSNIVIIFLGFLHSTYAKEKPFFLERPSVSILENLETIYNEAGVSAVVLLLRSDVKQSASIFKRNIRQIRHWLEEESASASKATEKVIPKELESKVPEKDITKDKH